MQRLAIQSPVLTMESARQLVEKVRDQRDSLGANDLHRKFTYSPKCIFGSSFPSASEPEVPEPEVLEHRTAPDLAEAEHRGQEERL